MTHPAGQGLLGPQATDIGRNWVERSGDLVECAKSPGDSQQVFDRDALADLRATNGLHPAGSTSTPGAGQGALESSACESQ